MSEFQTIDRSALETITGGDGGVSVDVPLSNVPLVGRFLPNIHIGGSQTGAQYDHCVDTVKDMPGATPKDIKDTCGTPTGQ